MTGAAGAVHSILWRTLDGPGHDAARLVFADSGWRLDGSAVFAHDGQPCRLDYRVVCDARWHTTSATVTGWVGRATVAIELTVDAAARWRLNGAECPAVAGCIDVDLNFTPVTNLLPIRRLDLSPGQSASVDAAWLHFPSFVPERLDQRYVRVDAITYRYESGAGTFVTDLTVNEAGFVTRYGDLWQAEVSL